MITAAIVPRLEGYRLIGKHDGDVVAHGISKPAGGANERGFVFPVVERSLATRTDEDGEEVGRERHGERSSGITNPKRRRAPVFRRQLSSTLTQRSK